MDIQTIEKGKMDALKSLSDTNLAVSKAQELLQAVKREESVYLKEREEKVLKQVAQILEDSQFILKDTLQNYNFVKDLTKSVGINVTFLEENLKDFRDVRLLFDKQTKDWEESVSFTVKQFEEVKKGIKIDKTKLKNDQEALERDKVALNKAKIKIEDERKTLERAIKRLQDNRI